MPEKTPLKLSDIARDVIGLVGHEAQRKQVTIYSQLGETLPEVEADRVQLQQVLLNLVMNGIEAMHETDANQRQLTVQTAMSNGSVLAAVAIAGSVEDLSSLSPRWSFTQRRKDTDAKSQKRF